jgi:hypothetical protein
MHEHFTHAIYYFEVHLIYSSIVWLAALVLPCIASCHATNRLFSAATGKNWFLRSRSWRLPTRRCCYSRARIRF